jgi:sporulation protein YlmC with PRC-barrel domain
MRLPLLLCVTSLVATTALAQREASPSSSPSTKAGSPGTASQPGISSQTDPSLSPTGRPSGHAGAQQCLRSTKLIGAPVKTSSGEDVGRIEDVVVNPTSGKIDLAVISSENKLYPVPWQLLSVSGQGGQGSQSSTFQGSSSSPSSTSSSTSPSSTSPSSTSPSSPTSPSSTSSSTSPSASAGVYASSSASMGQQPTFILNVDKTKLQSAPSFDRSRWPEMNATWSQRIYTHFGVQADTGVGGTGSGSYKSSTGSQTDQGSTGKSSDSSTGKSSSDTDSSPSKSDSDSKK